MFTAAQFIIAKSRKQSKCPSKDEQIKMWYTYIMGYYMAMKKYETMPFAATWMNLEIITLSEISQNEKDSLIWRKDNCHNNSKCRSCPAELKPQWQNQDQKQGPCEIKYNMRHNAKQGT